MNLARTLTIASLLAVSGGAFGADKVCKVDIAGTDSMQFDKKEIAVAADCTSVVVTLKHTGKLPAQAMGHNWVLSKTSDMQGVVNDGMAGGLAAHYVKPGDARVLAFTKVIGGGQTDSVTFKTSALKKGEAYTFFCSFPGHSALMKGAFKFG